MSYNLIGREYNNKIIIGYHMKYPSHNAFLYLYYVTGQNGYLQQLFYNKLFSIVLSDLNGNDDILYYYSVDTLMRIKEQSQFTGIKMSEIRSYVLKKQLMQDENFEDLYTYSSFCEEVNTLIKTDNWLSEMLEIDKKEYMTLWNYGIIAVPQCTIAMIRLIKSNDKFWYTYFYNGTATKNSPKYDIKSRNLKQWQEFKGYLAIRKLVTL